MTARAAKALAPLLVPLVLLVGGTCGYRIIEGPAWSWFDAFYMTAITLTTVGFLEVHELSPAGRMFTVFLCFGGIFTLFYAATEFIRSVVGGELQAVFGGRAVEQELAGLSGHLIVCGYGRMGRFVCEQFDKQRLRYVVIDRRPDLASVRPPGRGLPLVGDATSDDTLRRAGVERARALVAVLSNDADNLYITLSARLLSSKLYIVARAEGPETPDKLRRVGANKVVSPYATGGARVALAVLRPAVVDFLEQAVQGEHPDLQIEEVRLAAGSPLAGRTLREAALPVMVVAVRDAGGGTQFRPPADLRLEAGHTLVALGHRDDLDALERRAAG